jgi:hypothetical protein
MPRDCATWPDAWVEQVPHRVVNPEEKRLILHANYFLRIKQWLLVCDLLQVIFCRFVHHRLAHSLFAPISSGFISDLRPVQTLWGRTPHRISRRKY